MIAWDIFSLYQVPSEASSEAECEDIFLIFRNFFELISRKFRTFWCLQNMWWYPWLRNTKQHEDSWDLIVMSMIRRLVQRAIVRAWGLVHRYDATRRYCQWLSDLKFIALLQPKFDNKLLEVISKRIHLLWSCGKSQHLIMLAGCK